MVCLLTNEKEELYQNIGLGIIKFNSIELKNGEVWINGIIHFPANKIIEIKIQEGDD